MYENKKKFQVGMMNDKRITTILRRRKLIEQVLFFFGNIDEKIYALNWKFFSASIKSHRENCRMKKNECGLDLAPVEIFSCSSTQNTEHYSTIQHSFVPFKMQDIIWERAKSHLENFEGERFSITFSIGEKSSYFWRRLSLVTFR